MSELRYDPVKQIWSVIATDRSRKPDDFLVKRLEFREDEMTVCPFCKGHESKTGTEIYSLKGSNGWATRVVPNRYPAFRIEGELKRTGHGIYDAVNAVGAHEVVIETPRHDINPGNYTEDILYNLFYTFRERVKDLKKDTRFRYIMPFKNYGLLAGSNINHPHSQIIALPVTPNIVKTKLSAALEHYHNKERCLFCDILDQERNENTRIIYENQDFIALCPYASALPFEVSIYPKRHNHCFENTDEGELSGLADITKEVFGRLYKCLENPPLNMVVHTSPPAVKRPSQSGHWASIKEDFHWHIEITPRLSGVAGFESGTGFYINPVAPESAADYLKGAGN
ncbi:MAG: galactose-1-phosphate uridylyltransferase [Denitrovibrio sp.]|nr:MAG: galactose-1-phosphate uridylyltransferase [Denitrovibrio sp.]